MRTNHGECRGEAGDEFELRGALMSEKDEKKRALDLALSQIEKQYGKGAIMKLGEIERAHV